MTTYIFQYATSGTVEAEDAEQALDFVAEIIDENFSIDDVALKEVK